MSNLPTELKYTKSHEWVKANEDGTVTVGITDNAQELLGDLVFVELPEEGSVLDAGDQCAVVESVKAASDVYAPISGEIIAVNAALEDEPELVNADAFGNGWLFRMKPEQPEQVASLLDANSYSESLEA
jgi:glycine cleavage system H protein